MEHPYERTVPSLMHKKSQPDTRYLPLPRRQLTLTMLALALFAVLVPLATARPANLEWGAGQGFVAPFLTNSMTHAPPYPKNGNDVYLTDGPYNNWTYGQNQVIKWVSPYNQGDFCFDAGLGESTCPLIPLGRLENPS